MQTVLTKSIIPADDLEVLLEKLTNNAEYYEACMLALALYSGRRKSELFRFKVTDFDDNHLVCGGALYRSDELRTKGRGSRGKMLNCYTLARKFKPYLANWLAYRESKHIESDWLFPDEADYSKPATTDITNWSYRFSDLLGYKFYWHAIRHSCVTFFKRAGVPDSVIKTYIGWDSVSMVDTYADIQPEEELGKYFTAGGIIIPEATSITNL